jgi:hypothetical protein
MIDLRNFLNGTSSNSVLVGGRRVAGNKNKGRRGEKEEDETKNKGSSKRTRRRGDGGGVLCVGGWGSNGSSVGKVKVCYCRLQHGSWSLYSIHNAIAVAEFRLIAIAKQPEFRSSACSSMRQHRRSWDTARGDLRLKTELARCLAHLRQPLQLEAVMLDSNQGLASPSLPPRRCCCCCVVSVSHQALQSLKSIRGRLALTRKPSDVVQDKREFHLSRRIEDLCKQRLALRMRVASGEWRVASGAHTPRCVVRLRSARVYAIWSL